MLSLQGNAAYSLRRLVQCIHIKQDFCDEVFNDPDSVKAMSNADRKYFRLDILMTEYQRFVESILHACVHLFLCHIGQIQALVGRKPEVFTSSMLEKMTLPFLIDTLTNPLGSSPSKSFLFIEKTKPLSW